jgi:predicted nucleotidyltransferase component of viral defense system
VENPWFSGQAAVATYSREEMLATKLRALLQRDKGRDLFDLAHALTVFEGLQTARIIEYLLRYLHKARLRISRAEAEQRMFAKLRTPRFLTDMRPLIAPAAAEALTEGAARKAFADVFATFVAQLPGEPWARTEEMARRFGLALIQRGR